jgi:Ca2+-transporting ATPase
LQGGLALLLVGSVYAFGLQSGMPDGDVRALAFAILVLTNIGLILVNRSFSSSLWGAISRRNPALWIVLGVALPLLLAAVSWTPAQTIFRFGSLHLDDLAICLGATALLLAVLEILKRFWRFRLVM